MPAMTQTEAIQQRISQFVAALRTGKLEWSTGEFISHFLEVKTDLESFLVKYEDEREYGDRFKMLRTASLPGLKLGPIDPARAGLASKIMAGMVGSSVETVKSSYVFSRPTNDGSVPVVIERLVEVPKVVEKLVEVPVEKIVEKVVYRDREGSAQKAPVDDFDVTLKFPPTPPVGKANPKYQMPTWHKRMVAALESGRHVAIAGPPGIGKSTAPEQYFIGKNQPFVVVNGDAGFRRRDIEGSTEIHPGVGSYFKVAEFAAAAINGWGCILNEVNAADPDALMWINGILEVPHMINVHGKAYKVHKDFRLVVTYNPGLIGTKALPQAFKDRFFPIKLGFPPREFLKRLLVAKGGMAEHAGYGERLMTYAEDAWDMHVKGNLRYQISPRRLFDVVFLMDSGVTRDLDEAVKQAIVDAVDSASDAQMLIKLLTTRAAQLNAVSRLG